jgi:hypothetical protein
MLLGNGDRFLSRLLSNREVVLNVLVRVAKGKERELTGISPGRNLPRCYRSRAAAINNIASSCALCIRLRGLPRSSSRRCEFPRELCTCGTHSVHVCATTHRTSLLRPRTRRSTSRQYRIGRDGLVANCISTSPRDRSRRVRGPRDAWPLAAPPWTGLGPGSTSLNTSPGLARTACRKR